jgi:hypothetical protein
MSDEVRFGNGGGLNYPIRGNQPPGDRGTLPPKLGILWPLCRTHGISGGRNISVSTLKPGNTFN